MQKKPKVSIITPSYNQAQFLEQTIQSVLRQDYPDIEYIVVDGASTDGSVDIIKKYADKIDWWVSEPDSGQSEAINKGWARASGEIIGWLNSDDLMMPGVVSKMVNAFQDTPEAGFIYGDVFSIDTEGQIFNVMQLDHWDLDDLISFEIISQPGVFIRKDCLDRTGFLNPDLHFLMDVHLWLKLAQLATFRYLPGVVAAARYHPAAKNVAAGAPYGQDAYKIIEWMKTQPKLQTRMSHNMARVWAGAFRLSARYLLDAGNARAAVHDYIRCFRNDPRKAMKEFHRIIFSILSLWGMDQLRDIYYSKRLEMRRKTNPEIYQNIAAFLSDEELLAAVNTSVKR